MAAKVKKPERPKLSENGVPREPAFVEVLTLAEAADLLRIPARLVLQQVGPGGLPGRLFDGEWRFLKSALIEWLGTAPRPSSPEALHAAAGAWKGDDTLEEMLRDIHKRRGRPESVVRE